MPADTRNQLRTSLDSLRGLLQNVGAYVAAFMDSMKLVDELSRCVPEHLWLTSYEEQGNKVQIEGVTFSNLLVADFMTRLEASPRGGPGRRAPALGARERRSDEALPRARGLG